MNKLWIPEFGSGSTEVELYDAVATAQTYVDKVEERYRSVMAAHFAESFTRQISRVQEQPELLLTTDLMFLTTPRRIAITQAMGVIGCLQGISYGELDNPSDVHLSLDIAASHLFDATDPADKNPYADAVSTPLRHVHYIEHEPSRWGLGQ